MKAGALGRGNWIAGIAVGTLIVGLALAGCTTPKSTAPSSTSQSASAASTQGVGTEDGNRAEKASLISQAVTASLLPSEPGLEGFFHGPSKWTKDDISDGVHVVRITKMRWETGGDAAILAITVDPVRVFNAEQAAKMGKDAPNDAYVDNPHTKTYTLDATFDAPWLAQPTATMGIGLLQYEAHDLYAFSTMSRSAYEGDNPYRQDEGGDTVDSLRWEIMSELAGRVGPNDYYTYFVEIENGAIVRIADRWIP